MKIGMLMKILWKRHWWEVCLFILVSLCLSGLVWTRGGDRFLQGLVWLEVGSLVWLVVRVSVTQSGFGTFGGWRLKPVGRLWYLVSEVLLLIFPLMLAGLVRLFVAGEVLCPNAEGWGELLGDCVSLSGWLLLLFLFCKLIGLGWEMNDAPHMRSRFAWGVILTAVAFSMVPVKEWGKKRYGSGGNGGGILSPLSLDEVEDWQWLRQDDGSDIVEVGDVSIEKMVLRAGEVLEVDGLRLEITAVEVRGEQFVVEWRGSRIAEFGEVLPRLVGVMISYQGQYYGALKQKKFREDRVRIPLLNLGRTLYSSVFFSPLALPENDQTGEELLSGAEFLVSFGIPETVRKKSYRERKEPENEEERVRWNLAGYYRKDDAKGMKAELDQRGVEAMEEVLAAAPWSESGWEQIVEPYLLKFAREDDGETLLGMLERNPWMGDFFVKKGWGELAEEELREHLAEGKTLGALSVVYLAELGNKEMGEDLVNQLLRMSGDFDAVAIAVKGHAGVDWDAVRREAWRRMATGFGGHHVWVQWGAEMGEKEALRRLLVEASGGKKWERGVLEEWFGKDGDVVARLRGNWEVVVFEGGDWGEVDVR